MIIIYTLITTTITFASLIGLSAHHPIPYKSTCEVNNENNTVINWVIENGRCYYFSDLSFSYDKAREYCRELSNNSYLAVPSSNLELKFLLEHIQFNKSFIGLNIVSNHLISETDEDITFDLFGDITSKNDFILLNQSNSSCVVLDKDNRIRTYECEESLYFICEKAFVSENGFGKAEKAESGGGLNATQIVFIVIGGLLYFGIPIVLIGRYFRKYFAQPIKEGGFVRAWTILQIILIVLFSVGLALLIGAILLAFLFFIFILSCFLACCFSEKEDKVNPVELASVCSKPLFFTFSELYVIFIGLFFYFNKYDPPVSIFDELPTMPQPIESIAS